MKNGKIKYNTNTHKIISNLQQARPTGLANKNENIKKEKFHKKQEDGKKRKKEKKEVLQIKNSPATYSTNQNQQHNNKKT